MLLGIQGGESTILDYMAWPVEGDNHAELLLMRLVGAGEHLPCDKTAEQPRNQLWIRFPDILAI